MVAEVRLASDYSSAGWWSGYLIFMSAGPPPKKASPLGYEIGSDVPTGHLNRSHPTENCCPSETMERSTAGSPHCLR